MAVPGATNVVLGIETMKEVHADMERTILPSWLKPAPDKMGYTSHGKLSADQWRVACTVHYPITLIRLWGAGRPASKENRRFLEMLDNFMHLTIATSMAAHRTTSIHLQERVLHHMERYLEGLRVLYPSMKLRPNHHFTLHLPTFLRRFGPPRAWWCFPFERFNGVLQGKLTNSRFGESIGSRQRLDSDTFAIFRAIGDHDDEEVLPRWKPAGYDGGQAVSVMARSSRCPG